MVSTNAAPTIQQAYQAGGIVSPVGSTVSLGTVSATAIAANPNRRGIAFVNPGATVTLYVCPANQAAVIGNGIPVFPGGMVRLDGNPDANINFTSGWNAIAGSGSGNPLTVLEFV